MSSFHDLLKAHIVGPNLTESRFLTMHERSYLRSEYLFVLFVTVVIYVVLLSRYGLSIDALDLGFSVFGIRPQNTSATLKDAQVLDTLKC